MPLSKEQLEKELERVHQIKLKLINDATIYDGAAQMLEHLLKLEAQPAPPDNVVEMPPAAGKTDASQT